VVTVSSQTKEPQTQKRGTHLGGFIVVKVAIAPCVGIVGLSQARRKRSQHKTKIKNKFSRQLKPFYNICLVALSF